MSNPQLTHEEHAVYTQLLAAYYAAVNRSAFMLYGILCCLGFLVMQSPFLAGVVVGILSVGAVPFWIAMSVFHQRKGEYWQALCALSLASATVYFLVVDVIRFNAAGLTPAIVICGLIALWKAVQALRANELAQYEPHRIQRLLSVDQDLELEALAKTIVIDIKTHAVGE